MANNDATAARHFHDITKYVPPTSSDPVSIMMGVPPRVGPAMGEQDPGNEPFPYKVYTDLEPIALPRDFPESALPALDIITASGTLDVLSAVPDLAQIAHLCLRANGVLKRWRSQAGKEIEFRAAGCTGARYHLELYIVCGDIPGLAAGVYHYSASDHTLRLLRSGDYRAAVIAATGEEPAVGSAPVIAIWTSTFWRNAWRYQERAYRHTWWDAATALANLLAVAAEESLPTEVVLGFADAEINALLDVDGQREATVALVPIGRWDKAAPPALAIAPLNYATQQISASEIDFPEIWAMHGASSLDSGEDARAWRANAFRPEESSTGPNLIPLQPMPSSDLPAEPIDDVIARRRSNRHYHADAPLSFAELSTVLTRALSETAMDCLIPGAPPMTTLYLIVNNVEGLEPGAYVVHREAQALELLHRDDTRSAGRRLACGQAYADAVQVNVYALTDLEPVLAHFGNRGYRLAQLEAALVGAKLQLAAHALGLGAVGSTSYDDLVVDYFSPHAAGKSYMFIAVFGNKRKPSAEEIAAKSKFLQGAR
jgi:SagB-type dehydrogenase family enzyme